MSDEKLWFIIREGKLLFKDEKDGPALPLAASAPLPLNGEVMDIGEFTGSPCLAAVAAEAPPAGWLALDLFTVNDAFGREFFLKAGRAAQLAYWQQNSRFCPVCGRPTAKDEQAPAMNCAACGKQMFPKPTSAVLVLVEKGESLLLVRAHNFRKPFYGLVAGYLEPGETLEDCCRREVMEETALVIKNVRYFGSETWPFPNNVMIGFTAEYESGEICLQEEELAEAAFFKRGEMPELPDKISLTRRMIDWWDSGKKDW